MTLCEHCHQPIRDRYDRGPLTVMTEPLEVFWHGAPLKRPTPTGKRILALLVQRERASFLAFEIACLADNASGTLAVHVSQLRKAVPPDVRIISEPGWGYRLEVAG